MATVSVDLGSVIGPQGAVGPTGATYTLTDSDKEEIAEIVGDDTYLIPGVFTIDVYDATASPSSPTPAQMVYVWATIKIYNTANQLLKTVSNSGARVSVKLVPFTQYRISVEAEGYQAFTDQTVYTSDSAVNVQFSSNPVTEVRYTVDYKVDGTIVEHHSVEPHGSCSYGGSDPSVSGKIWTGWDGATTLTDIVANHTINATFVTPTEPSEPKTVSDYDYAWSESSDYTSAYTLAELVWILQSASNIQTYLPIGSKILFTNNLTASYFNEGIRCTLLSTKHYELSDGSGWARSSWMMQDVMRTAHNMNSSARNVGGWASCAMRTWLNGTVFPLLPQLLKQLIKTVKVGSTDGDQLGTVTFSDDKVYLLSYSEVGFGTGSPYNLEVADGANEKAFSIFTNNTSRVKTQYNRVGAQTWWLRSPIVASSSDFWFVSSSGGSINATAYYSFSVAAGFSI